MEMQTLIIDEYIDYIIRSRRRFCSHMADPAGTLRDASAFVGLLTNHRRLYPTGRSARKSFWHFIY